MPKKSMNASNRTSPAMPVFQNEAEEADWYHTPEGRRHTERRLREAKRKGVITVDERLSMSGASQVSAQSGGKLVRFAKGIDVQPTDGAILQELVARVKAKRTEAISLRLPASDVAAAKKLARDAGIGYQTVLKELISKGLREAS